ncbi:hypothetical protein [Vibrio mediterranei]|uniref:hypothetical protein n=1 Tax=Vibrio mediterranei TaxID=689 RepID=UPI00148B5317|nr:hypothetical protein [Vibrio mediterranei]NOH31115.1 hypothetical protein [Vibrio mediterranei]
MKLKLISAVIAASFLAGCSSSGSSNGGESGPAPQDGIADVQTYEGENANLAFVKGDNGDYDAFFIQAEDMTLVIINGETYTVTEGVVYDKHSQPVGNVTVTDGKATFIGKHGATATLTVVDGRLIASDLEGPIDPDFDNGFPLWGEEGAKELKLIEVEGIGQVIVVGDKPVGVIDTENRVIINGEVVGSASGNGSNRLVIDLNNGAKVVSDSEKNTIKIYHIDGTETIIDRENGGVISDKAPDNSIPWMPQLPEFENPINDVEFIVTNEGYDITKGGEKVGSLANVEHGHKDIVIAADIKNADGETIGTLSIAGKHVDQVYKLSIDEGPYSGTYYVDRKNGNIVKPELPASIGELTIEQKQELKSKLQSLTQEQRQQIKQAVKDRIGRS